MSVTAAPTSTRHFMKAAKRSTTKRPKNVVVRSSGSTSTMTKAAAMATQASQVISRVERSPMKTPAISSVTDAPARKSSGRAGR